eukprot:8372760-Prorocentrum_lima.AAC.1
MASIMPCRIPKAADSSVGKRWGAVAPIAALYRRCAADGTCQGRACVPCRMDWYILGRAERDAND